MKLLISRNINQNKDYLYKSIQKDLDNRKIVYLVVPEQFTLGKEIEAFDRLKLQSSIDFKIKSFKTIINEIIYETGGRSLNFLNDSSKYIIIQNVLLEIQKDLRIFHKNIYDKNFIEMINKFFDEMISNNIEINDLQKIILKDNISKELKNKLEDLILILKRFNEIKINSNYTNINRVDLAIKNIKNMENFKNINFYFDIFNDMSMQEIKLIEEIDKISNLTCINLILDVNLLKSSNLIEDSDVFDISYNFYNKLKSQIQNIEIINLAEYEANNQIEKLTNSMFSYNINTVKEKYKDKKLDNIFINKTNNTNEEVENLVVQINKDIINNSYKYSDIGILTTNAEEYYPKIKIIFELNNIPYFIDEARNLIENPMIKFIKSSIELLNKGLTPNIITQFLNSTFIKFDKEKLNLFTGYIQRKKIFNQMLFNDKYFKISENQIRYIDEDEENLIQIEEIRKIFIEIIEKFKDNKLLFSSTKKANIKELVNIFYEFISNEILIKPFINNELAFNDEIVEENRLIWDNLMETLDNLYNLSLNNEINFERFSEILISAIENFNIGIIPPSQDQIIIGEFKRSRFNKVKKLYVLGMSNIYYPIQNSVSDFLLNEEKHELIEKGIPIKNTLENINSNDLLSFYTLLNTATSKIVFSFSLVNSSNASMKNALIIDLIRHMIPKENYKVIKENFYEISYSKTLISSYLPQKLLNLKNGEKLSSEEENFINSLFKAISLNKDNYKTIYNAIEYVLKNYNREKISKELVEKIYNTTKFSASQLELFQTNPYDHFIKYGIKPREFDEYDITKLDTGNLIHDVLSKYIKYYYEKNLSINEIFDEALKNSIEDYKLENSKNKFFINQIKDNTKSYGHIIVNQNKDNNIVNMYFEEKYAKGSTFSAIEFDINNKKISLEGKIDRIDEFEFGENKYYRIIDYKTGNKKFDISSAYYGMDLQLLLYLKASLSKEKNSRPLGAFYQKLNKQINYDVLLKKDKEDNLYIPDETKLDGLICNNPLIIAKSDQSFNSDNPSTSEVYKFYGRGKSLEKKTNSINELVFYKFFEHNEKIIKNIIKSILDGDISLSPYRLGKNTNSYNYGKYKTIDKGEGLKYRNYTELTWEEVFEMLGGNDE